MDLCVITQLRILYSIKPKLRELGQINDASRKEFCITGVAEKDSNNLFSVRAQFLFIRVGKVCESKWGLICFAPAV